MTADPAREAEVEARAYFEAYGGTDGWSHRTYRHATALIAALDEARALSLSALKELDAEKELYRARWLGCVTTEEAQRLRDEMTRLRPTPDDPLDTPLPCEVDCGSIRFGKGVRLRALADAATRWLAACQGHVPDWDKPVVRTAPDASDLHAAKQLLMAAPSDRSFADGEWLEQHIAESRAEVRRAMVEQFLQELSRRYNVRYAHAKAEGNTRTGACLRACCSEITNIEGWLRALSPTAKEPTP